MGVLDQLGAISSNLLSAAEAYSSVLSKADDEGRNKTHVEDSRHPVQPTDDDARSLLWDPYAIVEQLGYKDRPSAITYGTLQQIVQKVPLIQAIIVTRLNQVAAFARPRRDMFSTGFRVRPVDEDAELSAADRKFAANMESMLLTTGATDNPIARDSFETFLRKVVRDSLTYDQYCHPAGTMVSTRDGLMPIEYVEEGEQVWTHEGRLRRVTELKRRSYTGEMTRLRWRGSSLEATEGHPILVLPNKWAHLSQYKDQRDAVEWMPAKDVQKGHYVVHPRVQLPEETVNTPFGVLDPQLGRVFGLYVADGHVSTGNTMVLTFGEHEDGYVTFLEEWAQDHGYTFRVRHYEDKAAISVRIYVGSEKAAWLKTTCGPNASNKTVPRPLFQATKKAREAFVAGYLEGDGQLKPYGATFNTTSRTLAYGLQILLSEMGVACSLHEQDYSDRGWSTQYRANLSGRFFREFGRRNGLPIGPELENHREPALVTDQYILFRVNGVERYAVEDLPVFNFEVDEDHSYIAEGIVSHNCFEITGNRKGLPAKFQAVDAATIRLADTVNITYVEDPDLIASVQVYDNMVINEYRRQEMAFAVRNPHTNIRMYGYGYSEIEMLINAITSWLWGFDYNSKFFNQGTVAKGLLNIQGTMNQTQLKAFRRQWYQMVSGVENAWRSPVLNSDGKVEWVNMTQTNRDMEFSAWMDFLIKLVGGIFQIDPMELGFKYGDSGAGKQLFESGTQAKLTASKDKGLTPLLHHVGSTLTDYLIRPVDKDWRFEFVGLEQESKGELAELNQKRVKVTHTLNELRAEQDLPPDEYGDIILDPSYIQWRTSQEQMKMAQEQQAGEAGAPGEGAEEGDGFSDFSEADFARLTGDDDAEDDGPEKTEKSMSGPKKVRMEIQV